MAYTFKDLHWSRSIPLKAYHLPESLEDALRILDSYQGKARVVAGGTDVIPSLRRRDLDVDALVDITRLPHMDKIERDGDTIAIGGLVTHAQAAASPLIREFAWILSRGAGSMGSPQIRNIATLSGNLASAHPAADAAIPLLSLGATVTISAVEGERTVALKEFFKDKGRTSLDSSREILTTIRFPVLNGEQGSFHQRLSKRRSLSIAVLIFSGVVRVDREKSVIKEAALALGPVAPIPMRAGGAEEILRGAPISAETVERAAEAAFEESNPITDPAWGSAEYKKEMVRVFVKRGLREALKRAGTPVK